MTLPVLLAPFPADCTVVVQFCFRIFVVEVLEPLVIPATPLQPVSLDASLTVEFTVVATPSFGSGGVHVSVPVNALHFGGNGPAAPAGADAQMPSGTSIEIANNKPRPLRMQ